MDEKNLQKKHRITLNNRREGMISGVTDVISFDVNEIFLETEEGMLDIKGKDLHVKRINLDMGEIDIDGVVDQMSYSEINSFSKSSASFLGRLFK